MEENKVVEAEAVEAPVPKKESDTQEVTIPEMPVVVDPEVKENQGEGLLESMLGYLKRYNGYNYCSVCRLDKVPEDTKKWSLLLQGLFTSYLKKHATVDDFKKTFLSKDLCYIQMHADCPTMTEDGAYNSISIDGKFIKTVTVGFFVVGNPDTFKPCILVRNGPGKVGDPGTLGIIYGDPYHKVTPEEAAEVIKQTQPDAVATAEEVAAVAEAKTAEAVTEQK